MTEIKKVIVNGVEYEVSVEVSDDGKWHATVEGTTFEVEIPDSGPVAKKKRSGGGKKKKSGTVSANIPGKIVTIEVEVGQEVEVLILEVDNAKRRISLGLKQCTENPWAEFSKNSKTGDIEIKDAAINKL